MKVKTIITLSIEFDTLTDDLNLDKLNEIIRFKVQSQAHEGYYEFLNNKIQPIKTRIEHSRTRLNSNSLRFITSDPESFEDT